MKEIDFRVLWISMLRQAMIRGKRPGYRMHSLKNRPPSGASHWRGERRPDKLGTTKLMRRLAKPHCFA